MAFLHLEILLVNSKWFYTQRCSEDWRRKETSNFVVFHSAKCELVEVVDVKLGNLNAFCSSNPNLPSLNFRSPDIFSFLVVSTPPVFFSCLWGSFQCWMGDNIEKDSSVPPGCKKQAMSYWNQLFDSSVTSFSWGIYGSINSVTAYEPSHVRWVPASSRLFSGWQSIFDGICWLFPYCASFCAPVWSWLPLGWFEIHQENNMVYWYTCDSWWFSPHHYIVVWHVIRRSTLRFPSERSETMFQWSPPQTWQHKCSLLCWQDTTILGSRKAWFPEQIVQHIKPVWNPFPLKPAR